MVLWDSLVYFSHRYWPLDGWSVMWAQAQDGHSTWQRNQSHQGFVLSGEFVYPSGVGRRHAVQYGRNDESRNIPKDERLANKPDEAPLLTIPWRAQSAPYSHHERWNPVVLLRRLSYLYQPTARVFGADACKCIHDFNGLRESLSHEWMMLIYLAIF